MVIITKMVNIFTLFYSINQSFAGHDKHIFDLIKHSKNNHMRQRKFYHYGRKDQPIHMQNFETILLVEKRYALPGINY